MIAVERLTCGQKYVWLVSYLKLVFIPWRSHLNILGHKNENVLISVVPALLCWVPAGASGVMWLALWSTLGLCSLCTHVVRFVVNNCVFCFAHLVLKWFALWSTPFSCPIPLNSWCNKLNLDSPIHLSKPM